MLPNKSYPTIVSPTLAVLPGVTLVLVGEPILTPSINPALRGVNLEVVGEPTQGSALFPIFRALKRSHHRHSPVAQGHLHSIHPSNLLSPSYTPSTHFRHQHPSPPSFFCCPILSMKLIIKPTRRNNICTISISRTNYVCQISIITTMHRKYKPIIQD